MKQFLKYIAATFIGLVLFSVVAVFGLSIYAGILMASSQSTSPVADGSVLTIKLSGDLEERSEDDLFGQLTGSTVGGIDMLELSKAIKAAQKEDKIKGIYIEGGILSADWAQLQELRRLLQQFRKSGKWIISYADNYTQGAYYLCSVADKVYINPIGGIDWHGIGSQPFYIKDLLKKFGVKMQVFKVGKYKSYTEMFTEDHMTVANRIQTSRYINGIWQQIVSDVSASRHISPASLNAFADSTMIFADSRTIKASRMVDGQLYPDEVRKLIRKKLGIDDDDDIPQASISDVAALDKDKHEGDEIAVYYAWGSIVQEPATGTLSSEHSIVGKDVVKDLEELADDDDVKAVVLRINSGGGSAYASEQMWHAIQNLKKHKPVVVSMSGMAASGGYYMSCGADYIFAEPTTLTGSIGIFGVIPDVSGLITEKLGIKFDEVKTNRNSIMGSSARPMNAEESAILQRYINNGYALFINRVAQGRRMKPGKVEEIAQGHVFLGSDAVKIGLVDRLGSLDDAIAKAASLAKAKEYYSKPYPDMPDWIEQLLNTAEGQGSYLDDKMRQALGDYYEPFMFIKTLNQQDAVQARCLVSMPK